MSMTYLGANGVFTQWGKPIKKINAITTLINTTYPADLDEIGDIFEAGNADNRREVTAAVAEYYARTRSYLVGRQHALAMINDMRLQDRGTVINELNMPDSSVTTLVDRLIDEMQADAATVDASTVTIGSVTADSNNVGNGTALVNKVLDGFNPPSPGWRPNRWYSGVNSELSVPSETMTLRCIRDSQSDGLAVGSEVWELYGRRPTIKEYRFANGVFIPMHSSPGQFGHGYGIGAEGSGHGPTIGTLDGRRIVLNGDFENFTSNVPESWVVTSGTAGTHIYVETTNIYRNSRSLRLLGDGATTVSLDQGATQGFDYRQFEPRRRYYLSAYILASTGIAAGDLNIGFSGTGLSATNTISIAPGGYPTAAFTQKGGYWETPATIPSDLKITIEWSGSPTSGKNVYIDSLAFGPVVYHGGVNVAVVAGSTAWKRNDKLTWTIANDEAGTFQEFARKWWAVQLPSNAAGGESIADTLAE